MCVDTKTPDRPDQLFDNQNRYPWLYMSLAQEVARKGVTVNTISPNYIATDMVMAVPEEINNKII